MAKPSAAGADWRWFDDERVWIARILLGAEFAEILGEFRYGSRGELL